MPRSRVDRHRIENDQTRATAHPARVKIMELIAKVPGHTLEAEPLAEALTTTFPALNPDYTRPPQVAYHVARLRDAELLPA
jgi:DNA-binding transcriptional ArsR family regulator